MKHKTDESEVSVKVSVDVTKIVKYCCITGICIVGIIFGAKTVKYRRNERG